MAGKLFVVLLALSAVQVSGNTLASGVIDNSNFLSKNFLKGWTSAEVIPELLEFTDILDLLESSGIFGDDLPFTPEMVYPTEQEIENKNPKNCVPYIPEAYSAAKAVQKVIGEAKALGKKLTEAAKKCKALSNAEEKKQCYQELKKQAKTEGKPIHEAYHKVRPKVIQSMANFDKCMA